MWREQRWKGAREQQEEDRGGTGGRLARMLRCISLSGAACAAKSNRKNRDFRTVLYVKGALMPLISPHSARPGLTLRRSIRAEVFGFAPKCLGSRRNETEAAVLKFKFAVQRAELVRGMRVL
eukprot:241702-Rhodomonas_salina.1